MWTLTSNRGEKLLIDIQKINSNVVLRVEQSEEMEKKRNLLVKKKYK